MLWFYFNKVTNKFFFLSSGIWYLQVNALIARELSGFTCTSSLTMNKKFQYRTRPPRAVLQISRSLLVNSCR